jgi:hypothetical protein
MHDPKPILPVRYGRWLRDWWTNPYRPRGNFPEHFTVGVTIVIACIAGIQACIYHQQKRIMESSGHQTQQLIDAANIQACAAQKIADASHRNAKAAESFSRTAIRQANAVTKQLRLQREVARIEKGGAMLFISGINFSHEGRRFVKAGVEMKNNGSNAADQVRACTKVELQEPSQVAVNKGHCTAFFPPPTYRQLPPVTPANGNVGDTVKAVIKAQVPAGFSGYIYVWGVMSYTDTLTDLPITAPFCKRISANLVLNNALPDMYYVQELSNCWDAK